MHAGTAGMHGAFIAAARTSHIQNGAYSANGHAFHAPSGEGKQSDTLFPAQLQGYLDRGVRFTVAAGPPGLSLIVGLHWIEFTSSPAPTTLGAQERKPPACPY